MWKRLALSAAAILVMLGANFDVVCSCEGVDGVFSPFELDRCMTAAHEAAIEICRGDVTVTAPECSYSLHFKGSEHDSSGLTDALLLSVDDVTITDCVYVNGIYLGTVADGDELIKSLRAHLGSILPAGASRAVYTQELDIQTRYGRKSAQLGIAEMGELINSLCPVIFVSENGAPIQA